mgnify:CR=1 FL=1
MEEYLIINKKNDEIEYIISVITDSIGTSYMMRRSKASSWSEDVRDKRVLTITDTGDNMIVDPKLGKKLEYDVYAELLILMNFIKSKDKNLTEEYMVANYSKP